MHTKNPLVEWSFERLVNLDLVRGVREPQLEQFLENLPATANSAVLTERLANIYDALGKPSSAIDAWQNALKLNPSPQQRIRIRRTLEGKLLARGASRDAIDNYQKLLTEVPDYAGRPEIEEKLKALEQPIPPPQTRPQNSEPLSSLNSQHPLEMHDARSGEFQFI